MIMMYLSYLKNDLINKERQRINMSKGKLDRLDCDIWIHHMQVPVPYFPQSSTGFEGVLRNDITGMEARLRVVLGNQFECWDSFTLPFRAKVYATSFDTFRYVVIGFTGAREMWIANYKRSLELPRFVDLSSCGAAKPRMVIRGTETTSEQ